MKSLIINFIFLKLPNSRIVTNKWNETVESVFNTVGNPCDSYKKFGSYRRGKKDCGDLDILITRRDGKASHEFLL